MSVLDVAIIGAGPAGLAAAIECTRRNLEHAVFDKGTLVDSIRRFPVHMVFFTTPELIEIGDMPLVTQGEKPTRVEALKYYRRVAEHYQLSLRLYEKVDEVQRRKGNFCLRTTSRLGSSNDYLARNVIVATGYYDNPNMLGVPGEELPKVSHYYREAHPYFGMEVAVIGGANSAAETALELYRSGARVTLIHRGKELSTHIKYWVRPDILNRIERKEIRAFFETEVVEILPEKLRLIHLGGEQFELPNDFVLALVGYHPDYTFLESAGIRIDPRNGEPEHNPDTMETNVTGLFVAGGIAAGREANKIFIENGRFHGEKIIMHIVNRR